MTYQNDFPNFSYSRESGKYNTDVREGYCEFAAGDELWPGMPIKCRSNGELGTIGGFITENQNRYFLTAAHVIANFEILGYQEGMRNIFLRTNTIRVTRGCYPYDYVGKVARWHFESDNEHQTSIDAALVKIEKDTPLCGLMLPPWTNDHFESKTGDIIVELI